MMRVTTRGEHRRAAILQAAYDLFIKQGYHGTSMRQIAKAAHLALGGLYNHFSSKEQVFEAVFRAYHPYHDVLPLIASAQGSTLEMLVQDAFQRMVKVIEERPGFLNLMLIEVVEFHSTHTRQLFATLLPQGMQIIEQMSKSFPEQMRDIPAPMVVRTFLGLFLGYYLTQTALAQEVRVEFTQNAMQQFVDIYLHGILAKPSPAKVNRSQE